MLGRSAREWGQIVGFAAVGIALNVIGWSIILKRKTPVSPKGDLALLTAVIGGLFLSLAVICFRGSGRDDS